MKRKTRMKRLFPSEVIVNLLYGFDNRVEAG
jgi:hypothetical protein